MNQPATPVTQYHRPVGQIGGLVRFTTDKNDWYLARVTKLEERVIGVHIYVPSHAVPAVQFRHGIHHISDPILEETPAVVSRSGVWDFVTKRDDRTLAILERLSKEVDRLGKELDEVKKSSKQKA